MERHFAPSPNRSDRRPIGLAAARADSCGDLEIPDDLVLQRTSGVLKRGYQTFRGDLRVRTQDVFTPCATGQQLEDVLDADPGSADTWLATEDSGARNDPVEHAGAAYHRLERVPRFFALRCTGKTTLVKAVPGSPRPT
jgi:hypothetical protein